MRFVSHSNELRYPVKENTVTCEQFIFFSAVGLFFFSFVLSMWHSCMFLNISSINFSFSSSFCENQGSSTHSNSNSNSNSIGTGAHCAARSTQARASKIVPKHRTECYHIVVLKVNSFIPSWAFFFLSWIESIEKNNTIK